MVVMVIMVMVMIMCNLHLQTLWMAWKKGDKGRRGRLVEVEKPRQGPLQVEEPLQGLDRCRTYAEVTASRPTGGMFFIVSMM